ncbi:Membrane-bound lytic murein transglycosylase B precursor [Methylibium sp. T29]|nr:Membrane-bound lytic murein transglycosylase B precursor [Methylibium sp. T29]
MMTKPRPLLPVLAATLVALGTLCPPSDAEAARTRKKPVALQDDNAPDAVTYGRRDDVVALAAGIAERRGLDRAWVEETLAQARYIPGVVRLIQPPPAGTAKNWAAYRARFVEPVRIRAGVAFWRDNERWLREAEARYGVPAAIVVGIVGVETIYAQHMGNFRVLDALATLSFDFPRDARRDRSPFFRDELESFLLLCRQQGSDPLALKGSYAGAIGMPQFMPSSWLKYAVDFDGDGRVDLHASAADVIGSVANYLAEFGWQRGQRPTTRWARRSTWPSAPCCWRPTSCPASAQRSSPSTARLWKPRAGSTRARWRWSNCRTATRHRATWPARRTSMRSRATTGRATTRWR